MVSRARRLLRRRGTAGNFSVEPISFGPIVLTIQIGWQAK
jgi:hypothetical protein